MTTVITSAPSGMDGGFTDCSTVSAVFHDSERGWLSALSAADSLFDIVKPPVVGWMVQESQSL
ncbi:hypothetical protein [Streptomyces colonosanans]|uniref:Uncharacterized protein n=1 Tax=Streptomyces colonosanans TaxID=1428652 RepID=A0A1S2PQH5_9ACTN|nr:hypothetical protein [Streptomyces colonosanans]OIJ95655.1 hypothetical protein BIV24_08650 [Streptomyces colonosanans]